MSLFLLALLVVGLGLALAVAIAARAGGRPRLARRALAAGGGAAIAYVLALIVVNATSAPRVLAPGEREAFCGAYLDCHVGLSIVNARSVTIGERDVRLVTISLSSDALRATLAPPPIALRVEDARGRSYERDRDAERTLGLRPELQAPLPAGATRTTQVAFAMPPDARSVRLRVELSDRLVRAVEGLLIGDPDGLLHAPVVHVVET